MSNTSSLANEINITTEHYEMPVFACATIQIDDGVTCSSAVQGHFKEVKVPEDGLRVRYFDASGNDMCPPTFVFTSFYDEAKAERAKAAKDAADKAKHDEAVAKAMAEAKTAEAAKTIAQAILVPKADEPSVVKPKVVEPKVVEPKK